MKKIETYQTEKKIVGIKIRTNNKFETNSLEGKIFPIVKQYFHQNIAARISNRLHPGTTYCIYTEYESDHQGGTILISLEKRLNLLLTPSMT